MQNKKTGGTCSTHWMRNASWFYKKILKDSYILVSLIIEVRISPKCILREQGRKTTLRTGDGGGHCQHCNEHQSAIKDAAIFFY
jgi:hypothetical protein